MTSIAKTPKNCNKKNTRIFLPARGGRRKNKRNFREANPSEFQITCAVARLFEIAAKPGVEWSHFPAGERRDAVTGSRLKKMGLQPGWPDFVAFHQGQAFGIELKTANGRTSPNQRATQNRLRLAGVKVAVCFGIDETIAALSAWGLLRVAP